MAMLEYAAVRYIQITLGRTTSGDVVDDDDRRRCADPPDPIEGTASRALERIGALERQPAAACGK